MRQPGPTPFESYTIDTDNVESEVQRVCELRDLVHEYSLLTNAGGGGRHVGGRGGGKRGEPGETYDWVAEETDRRIPVQIMKSYVCIPLQIMTHVICNRKNRC